MGLRSAGSIFKNPPRLSAGRLIEEAGLKGVRVRGAKVSDVHANFIITQPGARARDVLTLMGLIRDRVKERYGVTLEPEVVIVGEE